MFCLVNKLNVNHCCDLFFCAENCPHNFFREDTPIKELQINNQIQDKEVRLIGVNGEQLGIVSIAKAQQLADEQELDLVKIAPTAQPPVCKILDYGKHRYDQMKREKEAKKNQKIVELKEVRLSMTIDVNDINIKAKNASKFLKEGNKVKVSLKMRGRQTAFASQGIDVMNKFYEGLKDVAVIEKKPATEGRNIIMILAPSNNK